MITNLYFKSKLSALPFVPTDIAGCQLWLKADAGITKDGSNYVSQWADQSGNNNHAVQATGSAQPLWVDDELNGMPVIRFDGNSDWLSGTIINNINTSSLSLFIVANGGNVSYGQGSAFFGINVYPSWLFVGRNTVPTEQNLTITQTAYVGVYGLATACNSYPNTGFSHLLIEGIKSYNNYFKGYINGSLYDTKTNAANIGTFTNDNYYISKNSEPDYIQFHKGDIVEVIIYTELLTDSERQQVENYINTKYALW